MHPPCEQPAVERTSPLFCSAMLSSFRRNESERFLGAETVSEGIAARSSASKDQQSLNIVPLKCSTASLTKCRHWKPSRPRPGMQDRHGLEDELEHEANQDDHNISLARALSTKSRMGPKANASPGGPPGKRSKTP